MGTLDAVFTDDPQSSPWDERLPIPVPGRMIPGPGLLPGLTPQPTTLGDPGQAVPLTTPPFNPNTATGTSGATGNAAPASSQPAYPNVDPSASISPLDQILSADRNAITDARNKLNNLSASPERVSLWNDPNHGKLRTLLAIFGGAVRGGITGDVGQGLKVMEPLLMQPQQEADKKWQSEHSSAEQNYENAMRSFSVDLAAHNAQAAEADRRAAEANRQKMLGLEQQRLNATTQGEKDRTDIERQRLQFEQGKANQPQNEVELALSATKVGPDGKPTAEAQQSAQALKLIRQQRISEIMASKDPNDRAKLLRDLQTNDVAVRDQLNRELIALSNNPLHDDPATQAQMKSYRDQIDRIDADLTFVNDQIRGALRMPQTAPPRPKSVPPNAVWNPQARQWQLPRTQ